MRSGAAISGIGHAAVIALVVMGLPWFSRRDRPPVPVTEVSFVSQADFDRAQAASQAPRVENAPALQPVARPSPTPPTPPKPVPAKPTAEPAPPPEPEVTSLAPDFNPDAPLTTPETQPALSAPTLVEPAPPAPAPLAAVTPPLARPAPTIAPTPTPPAPVTARPAEEATPVPTPTPTPQPPREQRPQTAPPEAAPEVAAPTPPEPPKDLALASSAPPKARPAPRATPQPDTGAAQQEAAVLEALKREVSRRQTEATPATAATAPTPPSVTPPTEATGAATETSLPSGPPITNAEKDGLRLAVQRCWVVPAGLRDAGELKVTLAAELQPDGSVVAGSIRLIDPSPAPDARFQSAYDAGRRALLRCAPYADLPRDKYAQWRSLEVVFDPKGMVSW